MLAILSLAALGFASLSYASPLAPRQSNFACTGLGNGAESNTGPFNLYAYNANTATNTTGLPLVVTQNPSNYPPIGKLATWESYQQGPLSTLQLINNTLSVNNLDDGEAVDLAVSAGSEIEWQFPSPLLTPAAAAIYCVVDNGDPAGLTDTALLLINDGGESFALCEDVSSGLNVVVYDPAESNGGVYDYSTCSAVQLHVYYQ